LGTRSSGGRKEARIKAYVRYKREEEVDTIRMRPHPWEFAR